LQWLLHAASGGRGECRANGGTDEGSGAGEPRRRGRRCGERGERGGSGGSAAKGERGGGSCGRRGEKLTVGPHASERGGRKGGVAVGWALA